ncbi:hypothetical protein BOX15_Mlig016430g1, partial [Macrostomum lignano]
VQPRIEPSALPLFHAQQFNHPMAGLGPAFSNTDQYGWSPDGGGFPGLMRNTSPVPSSSSGGGGGIIGAGFQSSMPLNSAVGKQPNSGLFPQQLGAPGPSSQPDQQRASKLFDHSSADFSDGLLSSVGSPASSMATYSRQISASGKLQGAGGSGVGIVGVGSGRLASGVPPGSGLGLASGSGGSQARSIPGLMLQAPVGQKRLPDPSEFPMLGRPASAGVSGRINFVSAASKAPEEFSIQQEDFPALPGTQPATSAAPGSVAASSSVAMPPNSASLATAGVSGTGGSVADGGTAAAAAASAGLPGSADPMTPLGRSTVVYHQNGSITGVPASMVRDQFGMIGLLSLIKVGDENPNFVIIAPGIDLNSLGLPLNNTSEIYSCLGSPWAEQCLAKPQYIDYPVPQEYLVGSQIREKLPPPPLDQLQFETLFWLFYNCTCDHLQLSAAKELHRREWRWIKSEKLWVTRCQQNVEKIPAPQGERGFYYYWDTKTWTRQQKSLTIYYDQIDQSPCNYPDHHVSVGTTLGAAVPGAASGASVGGAGSSGVVGGVGSGSGFVGSSGAGGTS